MNSDYADPVGAIRRSSPGLCAMHVVYPSRVRTLASPRSAINVCGLRGPGCKGAQPSFTGTWAANWFCRSNMGIEPILPSRPRIGWRVPRNRCCAPTCLLRRCRFIGLGCLSGDSISPRFWRRPWPNISICPIVRIFLSDHAARRHWMGWALTHGFRPPMARSNQTRCAQTWPKANLFSWSMM